MRTDSQRPHFTEVVRAAPSSTILVRAIVGAVFLVEGVLKFLDPQGLGVGRFAAIGIPLPSVLAPFDAVFEIGCGIGLMLGLLTRWSTIPMIINMIVAITATKIPILLREDFWKAAHEARLDFTMLFACLFLLLAGPGPLSLDSRFGASIPALDPDRSLGGAEEGQVGQSVRKKAC